MLIDDPDSNVKRQKEWLIVFICLLFGIALRFYNFDQKSLWMDEIHTLNDSRDNLGGQLKFYREYPTYLHPPLFFILTHLFSPFPQPERDLRIIPLIFGVLSVPMIYVLARSFSHAIASFCALSLTFMAYHIYFSQEGRSYSMVMFLGMVALYFFIQHLKTSEKKYLFLTAPIFALLFYTSYSAIPFILFSQMLWFYRLSDHDQKPSISSFFFLNGLLFLLLIPWLLLVLSNCKGQPLMPPQHTEDPGPLWDVVYKLLNDWTSNLPLIILSAMLLVLFPFFAKHKRQALILLTLSVLPILSVHLFCKYLGVTHFFNSRYFIAFLPLFLISIFLSLDSIELKLKRLRKFIHLKFFFATFLIISNLVILPLYYRSEKQDLRGLVNYLKGHLRDGDNIFVGTKANIPGIFHYLGIYPRDRHHTVSFSKDREKEIEHKIQVTGQPKTFSIYHSKNCCAQYTADGNRLWIIVDKWVANKYKKECPCVLKGYFDGSFASFNKFPTDASIYLFLWDPKSPEEKGIDLPIE